MTAPTPTPAITLSPRVLDAVSALLLEATDGYDNESHFTRDDLIRARDHGGALHIIEHADGGVTVTKSHHDQCPFITSSGTQECDDCSLDQPA
jgi:hypothetical protein